MAGYRIRAIREFSGWEKGYREPGAAARRVNTGKIGTLMRGLRGWGEPPP